MIENIGSDNVALFDTSIMLSIGASNKEELNTLFNTVRSTIGASYLQATEIKRKEFEPYIIFINSCICKNRKHIIYGI